MPFGQIVPPTPLQKFGGIVPGGQAYAVGNFLNLTLRLLIYGAAIYALFNFILAGYTFLSAGEDSKKIEAAWAKIWQTALGLAVAAGSFVLAAIFGWLIFGDFNFIINPSLPTL